MKLSRCYFPIEFPPQKAYNHFINIKKEDLIMAYVINDDCISCGACAAGCPVEAISEGASHYEINADVCVDCGACNSTCPVGAPNPQ
jgi:ferredoxin